MPHRSAQDIYAKCLLPRSYGYPLWSPEPASQLINLERTDGLRIGDVGIVSGQGCFDVLFNICLPSDHPFHVNGLGVPEGFRQVELKDEDIRTTLDMLPFGGCVTSKNIGPPQTESDADTLSYKFNLPSKPGALLVLPEGADCHVLLNEARFLGCASQHGANWYHFARTRSGRIINCHALYLITGFYKTKSWSVAAYDNFTTAANKATAEFRATQIGGNSVNIRSAYTWPTPHPAERRMGPTAYDGSPSQTVFVSGYKISLRDCFPGLRRIVVKADSPADRPKQARLSRYLMPNFWHQKTDTTLAAGDSSSTSHPATGHASISRASLKAMLSVPTPKSGADRVFHPCDVINEYLLQQEPTACIAISHDKDWIALLENGLLTPDELVQEEHLRKAVSQTCNPRSQGDVVYLERKSAPDASDKRLSVTRASTFKAGILQHFVATVDIWSGIRKQLTRHQRVLHAGLPTTRSVDSGIGQIPPGMDKPYKDSPSKQGRVHEPGSQGILDPMIDQGGHVVCH